MYKQGSEEFAFVKREPINKINKSNIGNIVDSKLAQLIEKQLGRSSILDWQGNPIRHVRIRKKSGKQVKERIDYRSEKEYKNFYYAESGDIPYGVMLFKPNNEERELAQVHAYQIAEVFREKRSFDVNYFISKFYPEKSNYKKLLLKRGQNLIVLNDDSEFNQRNNPVFQKNRLYKIIKIDNGSLWLKFHLTATADGDLDDLVKQKKIKYYPLMKINMDYQK